MCVIAGNGAEAVANRLAERKSFAAVTVFLALLRNVNWRAASGRSGAKVMRSQPIFSWQNAILPDRASATLESLSKAKDSVY
jgi:hypothetical protein